MPEWKIDIPLEEMPYRGERLDRRELLDHIRDSPGYTAVAYTMHLQDLGYDVNVWQMSGFLAALSREKLIRREGSAWVPVYDEDPSALWGYEAEVGDARICDVCAAYAKKGTFTEEEITQEFPYLRKVSPFVWRPMVHPNCRCRLVQLVTVRLI